MSLVDTLKEIAGSLKNHDDRIARLETLERSTAAFGTCYLIEDIILASPASPVTFDNIPQVYKHLELILTFENGGIPIYVRFNGDGGANYDWGGAQHGLEDAGAPAYVAHYHARSYGGEPNTSMRAGGGMENIFGVGRILFGDYTAADKGKTMLSYIPIRVYGVAEAPSVWAIEHEWGFWNDTDALIQIDIYSYLPGGAGTFATGSRFSLYGFC